MILAIVWLSILCFWLAMVLLAGLAAEHRRKRRFPIRINIDGEVACWINEDGISAAAPRWDWKYETDGSRTICRRA